MNDRSSIKNVDKIKKIFLAKIGVGRKIPSNHIEMCRSFFDAEFYRQSYNKSRLSDEEALVDYLTKGWLEGLDPSPEFSTSSYLRLYPDVNEASVNPLLHYVLHGVYEDRQIILPASGFDLVFEELTSKSLRGWAVNNQNPGEEINIDIFIDSTFHSKARTDRQRRDLHDQGISAGKGGFHADIPFDFLERGFHLVEVVLPDGRRIGREIEIGTRSKSQRRHLSHEVWDIDLSGIKVIVPIYNAVEDVIVCIDRLRAYTPQEVEVILIDDCSSDPKIQSILASLSADAQFRILKNHKNLGFTQTVNRGFDEAGEADVIILNSDARVTPRWLEGLYAAAHSQARVATVTAMSDRAGAFSAPNIGNENSLPPGIDEISYARAFRRRSLRLYPEVPTGNGFCMYIRRAALRDLGGLDASAFPRGYGEENDFCMRAMQAGWVNLIDDATYVFHDRSKSFGEEKGKYLVEGRKVIDTRYPDYKILIKRFHEGSLINLARFRARQALQDCQSGTGVLPRALFVLATRTGGTPQTNADLMSALSETFECWVLSCDSKVLGLSRYYEGQTENRYSYILTEAIDPVTHRSSEYDAVVSEWLEELECDVVHIRHLAWHSLSLPELARRSGARVVYSLHDFYTLCPSLKLLDDMNNFCEGQCSTGAGHCRVELWPAESLPPLKNAWVHQWRNIMARALSPCDAFVTTSHSARERVISHMPSLPREHFHVIPHGRDFPRFEHLQQLPNADGPIRVLVPGNIDEAKGLGLIADILRLDKTRNFEFHVLGGVHLSWLKGRRVPRLYLHDRYQREDFAQKVRKIAPHFGVVFSIWDETYCHTLTEMWSVGLPVAVLDFPNLRVRVEDSGAGWVLESHDPQTVYNELSSIAANQEDLIAKSKAVTEWQMRRGSAQSCRQMAARYLDVYRGSRSDQGLPKVAVVCPADQGLRTAFASTEIRIWERTRNRIERPVDYIRTSVTGLLGQMRLGMVSGAIIQRTAIPALYVDAFLRAAHECGIPYIFELDDQLMKVPPDKDQEGFYEAYTPFLEKLLRGASAVIVSTDTLSREIREFNKNVFVVPNRISGRLWGGEVRPVPSHEPRLLYMGTKTHDEDLTFALDAIKEARRTSPNLRLKLIGVTGKRDLPEWVDHVDIPDEAKTYSKFVPWLRHQAADTILAIAPLMSGDFNQFKSALKLLDYGALGLPVLASDVECYRSFDIPSNIEGITLLRNSKAAWAQEISSKVRNIPRLSEEGMALREWVFKNHMLEPSLPEFDKLVLGCLGTGDVI